MLLKMRVIFGALIWLLVLLVLGVPFVMLSILKIVITQIYCTGARRNNINDLELLSLSKADVLMGTSPSWKRSRVNVAFVLKVEGKIGVDEFQKHFAKCFNLSNGTVEISNGDLYSKLFSFIDIRCGYAFRACSKSSLNLAEHIRERKLERRCNRKSDYMDTESLDEFLARWMLEEYRECRPCWESAVISITNSDDGVIKTAIAFRIHHALCDGYSILHIIDKLTGSRSPYIVKDFQEGFGTRLRQILEAPINLAISAKSTPPQESNPFRVTESKYEWMFSFTSFPLEDLKSLRRKNGGVHMTSVIWTLVSGALRRFLIEDVQMKEIPEFFVVGSSLPWPNHPAMNPETKNDCKMCNHWVSATLNIPLREPDPLVRLQRIEQEYVSLMTNGSYKCQTLMYSMLSVFPSSITGSMLAKDHGMTSALTSLIGAGSYELLGFPVKTVNLMLAGHDTCPWVPLSCFTFSHSGKMELTMGASPLSIIKDNQILDRICHKFCHEEAKYFLTATQEMNLNK